MAALRTPPPHDQIIGGVIAFEDNDSMLFADVVDAPPDYMHAYKQGNKRADRSKGD